MVFLWKDRRQKHEHPLEDAAAALVYAVAGSRDREPQNKVEEKNTNVRSLTSTQTQWHEDPCVYYIHILLTHHTHKESSVRDI